MFIEANEKKKLSEESCSSGISDRLKSRANQKNLDRNEIKSNVSFGLSFISQMASSSIADDGGRKVFNPNRYLKRHEN